MLPLLLFKDVIFDIMSTLQFLSLTKDLISSLPETLIIPFLYY
ncbi:hypothetical protein IFVP408_C2110268 [Vibrio parahaemolyticus]